MDAAKNKNNIGYSKELDEYTIQGSDKNDTIRVHNFTGENTVEIIDGGAGIDILSGGDERDNYLFDPVDDGVEVAAAYYANNI